MGDDGSARRLDIGPRRPIADDELGAGQIEIEKRGDVLFDCNPADGEEYGAAPEPAHGSGRSAMLVIRS